jgi:hypothetical protein
MEKDKSKKWELRFNEKFGKFQHRNEAGLFNQEDYIEFIRETTKKEREEAYRERNKEIFKYETEIIRLRKEREEAYQKGIEDGVESIKENIAEADLAKKEIARREIIKNIEEWVDEYAVSKSENIQYDDIKTFLNGLK